MAIVAETLRRRPTPPGRPAGVLGATAGPFLLTAWWHPAPDQHHLKALRQRRTVSGDPVRSRGVPADQFSSDRLLICLSVFRLLPPWRPTARTAGAARPTLRNGCWSRGSWRGIGTMRSGDDPSQNPFLPVCSWWRPAEEVARDFTTKPRAPACNSASTWQPGRWPLHRPRHGLTATGDGLAIEPDVSPGVTTSMIQTSVARAPFNWRDGEQEPQQSFNSKLVLALRVHRKDGELERIAASVIAHEYFPKLDGNSPAADWSSSLETRVLTVFRDQSSLLISIPAAVQAHRGCLDAAQNTQSV